MAIFLYIFYRTHKEFKIKEMVQEDSQKWRRISKNDCHGEWIILCLCSVSFSFCSYPWIWHENVIFLVPFVLLSGTFGWVSEIWGACLPRSEFAPRLLPFLVLQPIVSSFESDTSEHVIWFVLAFWWGCARQFFPNFSQITQKLTIFFNILHSSKVLHSSFVHFPLLMPLGLGRILGGCSVNGRSSTPGSGSYFILWGD